MTLGIDIDVSKLNTEERRLKAHTVAGEMFHVINSFEFERNFLSEFDEEAWGELSAMRHYDARTLFKHLLYEADGLINLYVDDYYSPGSVVGYTREGAKYIFVNTKFFDTNATKKVGSNFIHEWSHQKGFKHATKKSAARDNSFSYKLNKVYEKTWDQLYGGHVSENDKVLVCKKRFFLFNSCKWVSSKNAVTLAE